MRKAVKVILFTTITLVALYFIYGILKWKDTAGDYASSVEVLKSLPDDTVDVAFVGSSHVFCGTAPYVLWRDYGISSFAMAVSGMDRVSEYYYAKELCKTQSPKIIAFDLYGLQYGKQTVESNVYRNLLSMGLSRNNMDLINEYTLFADEEEKKWDYILRWPIVHTRYKELKREDFMTPEYNFWGLGEYLFNEVSTREHIMDGTLSVTEIGSMDSTQKEWIDRVVALAQEEGFVPLFYVAPYMTYAGVAENFNAIGEYIESCGYCFINGISENSKLNLEDSDFLDESHLNRFGAEKLMSRMADTLLEIADLPDHRGDGKYSHWDANLLHYGKLLEVKAAVAQAEAGDVEVLFDKIRGCDNYVCFVALDGKYTNASIDVDSMMAMLDVEPSEYSDGGVWAVYGGVASKAAECTGGPYYYEVAKYKAVEISRNESDYNVIYYGDGYYFCARDGVTFTVLDLISGEMIGYFGF